MSCNLFKEMDHVLGSLTNIVRNVYNVKTIDTVGELNTDLSLEYHLPIRILQVALLNFT